ncbi:MAG: hypothetical protein ACI9WU_001581, partial [Myxococcota bacterium]
MTAPDSETNGNLTWLRRLARRSALQGRTTRPEGAPHPNESRQLRPPRTRPAPGFPAERHRIVPRGAPASAAPLLALAGPIASLAFGTEPKVHKTRVRMVSKSLTRSADVGQIA